MTAGGDDLHFSNDTPLPSPAPCGLKGTLSWIAPILTPSGYGDEARGFLQDLFERGVPLQAIPVGTDPEFAAALGREDPALLARIAQSLRLEVHKPLVAVAHLPAAWGIPHVEGADVTVARTMWETDGLPETLVPGLNGVDEIWVPSHFNVDTFRAAGVRAPIHVIGGGVDTSRFHPGIQSLPIAGRRSVVFLAMFEWSYRKGWDVLFRAWADAFAARDDVTLVLRTRPPAGRAAVSDSDIETDTAVDDALAAVGLERASLAPIVTFGRHVAPRDVPRLMASADCYVAPSRGEGWGRPQQEAMATGIPVIATRWSGNLDFMDDSNSLLIEIEGLVPVDARMEVPLHRGQRWAEPSAVHLAELLQRVASSEDLRRKLGQRARADMESRWQWQHVTDAVNARLRELTERSAGSFATNHSGLAATPAGADTGSGPGPATSQSPGVSSPLRRTPLVLAHAQEILEDDRILSDYVTVFGQSEEAVLVVYGPGLEPTSFETSLRERAAAWGLDLDDGPKLLVLLPPTKADAQDRELASKVVCVVTGRPTTGAFETLEVIAPGDRRALRHLADRFGPAEHPDPSQTEDQALVAP